MKTSRLEAFSDGVIAILITIMVLELKTPEDADWTALRAMSSIFCAYVLSFVFLGIYWNNHHHMLHMTHRVTGGILWANLHLLFWLSLIPFATAWMGHSHVAPLPTATYGFVLMMAGMAYYILKTTIIRSQGASSPLQAALGSDAKGKLSVVGYLVAVPIAFTNPWLAAAIYVGIALIWLIPDRRIERHLQEHV
jgi:TMEM175 potassium channel family protein